LVELPARCEVTLVENPLPPTVIEAMSRALETQRATDPARGPRIIHSMSAGHEFPVRPLQEEIASWYPQGTFQEADQAAWRKAIADTRLDEQSQQALSSVLGRQRLTAHYRVAQPNMEKRVHALLEQLRSAPAALATCAAQAVEGTVSCDDRIALTLLLMEETLLHQKARGAIAQPDAPKTLREIAMGLYKSDVLKEIAHRRIDTASGFIDPTEFILKYWVKLSKELALPSQIKDMIFHGCAEQVSDDDIDNAREAVHAAERDTKKFESYLASWAPWQALLEKRLPQDYREAQNDIADFRQKCHDETTALCESLKKIRDTEGELSDNFLNTSRQIGEMPQTIRNFEIEQFKALSKQLYERLS
jgi:hypothetical protein